MKDYKVELKIGKYYRFSYHEARAIINYVKILSIGKELKVKGYKIFGGQCYRIESEDWDLEIEDRTAEEISEEEFETSKMMELL